MAGVGVMVGRDVLLFIRFVFAGASATLGSFASTSSSGTLSREGGRTFDLFRGRSEAFEHGGVA